MTDLAPTAAELRLVLGRIVRRLRALGDGALTASQLSALANLEEHGPLRLRDLARHEGVRPPTASRLVDPLAERGLVRRCADPADARGTIVALTTDGADLLTRTRANRTAAVAEAMARLDSGQVARLAAAVPALHALLAQMQAAAPDAPGQLAAP